MTSSRVASRVGLVERGKVERERRRRNREFAGTGGAPVLPRSITEALDRAIAAEALIPGEQAKIDLQIALERDEVRRVFLEYQRDLVAWQLHRAASAARARKAHFEALVTDEDWEAEKERCRAEDPGDGSAGTVYWFRYHAWTMDPREDAPLAVMPFEPFEFQERSIRWTDDLVFNRRSDGVIEKSRDMGATWEKVCWSVKHWTFRDHFSVLIGSIDEDKIDQAGEMDTVFEKIRFQLLLTHPRMLPAGFDQRRHCTYMHVGNPENGAMIVGEAPTVNFGRSGRYTAILFDELAFWRGRGKPQWTAASQSSRSKICFSTVNGKQNKQYELRQTKGMPLLRLHWRLHPWKDVRWYKGQRLSMKEHEIAQELDMDHSAAQTGRLLRLDEVVQVITLTEYAKMFGAIARDDYGRPRLPLRGYIGMGQDVGTTEQHPNASGWAWRPHESMPYCDSVFVYRERVFPEWPEPTGKPVSVGRIAKVIYDVEKPWHERERANQMRLLSHEGASERATYQWDVQDGTDPAKPDDHRLTFLPWTVDARAGLSQLQNYMQVDYTQPHPVRTYPEGAVNDFGEDIAGQPVMGRSRFYIVVADGQGELYWADGKVNVTDAVDCHGMARLRAEIPEYRLPTDTSGDEKEKVKPLFNDCVDWLKALAHKFFPDVEPLTQGEQILAHLDRHYPLPKVDEATGEPRPEAGLVSQVEVLQTRIIEAQRMTREMDTQYTPRRRRGGL